MFYTTILEDKEGNIWVGTWRDGLFCYNPTTRYFKHYTHHQNDPNSLPNNRVNSLFEDSKNQIWIATEGGMAKKKSNQDSFENIGLEEGMPSNVTLAFLEDKQQNLWVSTSKGLVRYHLPMAENGSSTWSQAYRRFSSITIHLLMTTMGTSISGTINGLIRFNPEKLSQLTIRIKYRFISLIFTSTIERSINIPMQVFYPNQSYSQKISN
jgi:ligand-binding sensor domain-containing protein